MVLVVLGHDGDDGIAALDAALQAAFAVNAREARADYIVPTDLAVKAIYGGVFPLQ